MGEHSFIVLVGLNSKNKNKMDMLKNEIILVRYKLRQRVDELLSIEKSCILAAIQECLPAFSLESCTSMERKIRLKTQRDLILKHPGLFDSAVYIASHHEERFDLLLSNTIYFINLATVEFPRNYTNLIELSTYTEALFHLAGAQEQVTSLMLELNKLSLGIIRNNTQRLVSDAILEMELFHSCRVLGIFMHKDTIAIQKCVALRNTQQWPKILAEIQNMYFLYDYEQIDHLLEFVFGQNIIERPVIKVDRVFMNTKEKSQ